MTASNPVQSLRQMPRLLAPTPLLSALCALLPSVTVLSSRAIVPLLVILAMAALLGTWLAERRLPRPDRKAMIALALFFGWAAITAIWTIDVSRALLLLVRLGLLVALGLSIMALLARLDAREIRTIARWLMIGFAIAVLLVAMERLLGQPLYQLLNSPSRKQSLLSGMNRGATGLAILVWPVAALLSHRLDRLWPFFVLPLIVLILLGFLESGTALLGLGVGGLVLLLTRLTRAGHKTLAVVVVATVVLAPLGIGLLTKSSLDEAGLQETAQHRLHIWSFTLDRIEERPLFGWGFNAARGIPNMGYEPFNESQSRVIPSHPHNGELQIWMELGAVGALIAALGLALLMWRSGRQVEPARSANQALYMSALAAASTGFGLWQHQWVTFLLFAAFVAVLTARACADTTGGDQREGPPSGAA